MNTLDTQVLFIKGDLKFTQADVLEVATTTNDGYSFPKPLVVEQIPIKTIKRYKASTSPLEPAKPALFHGMRLAIHPDVEPLLVVYYQAQLEAKLERARKEIEQIARECSRAANQLAQETNNGNELYCRIKRFNDLSFWAKLKLILKGKGV